MKTQQSELTKILLDKLEAMTRDHEAQQTQQQEFFAQQQRQWEKKVADLSAQVQDLQQQLRVFSKSLTPLTKQLNSLATLSAMGGVGDDNFVRAVDIVFDLKRRTVSPEAKRSGAVVLERPPRLGGVGGTGDDSVRRPDKFPGRSDVYRGEKIEGINCRRRQVVFDAWSSLSCRR